ncbi:MAG: GAF domain-containing protein [Propionivibrio sp.]
MSRLAQWLARSIVERPRLTTVLSLIVIAFLSWLVGDKLHVEQEKARLRQLGYETERRGIELMAKTKDGGMMGSLTMLGLIDPAVKVDARVGGKPGFAANSSPYMLDILASLGLAYEVEGVFVVAGNGVIASSWDDIGKPLTGLDVKFRPYFQMAMRGKENVYAAVSLARGDRVLYFAAPVYAGKRKEGDPIGVAVGRSNVEAIDQLLQDAADDALLLSPQGVVFASSRKEWIGSLAGTPSLERLTKVRELGQFGTLIDKKQQVALPFSIDDGLSDFEERRIAVASVPVAWNDPTGDWKLVLIEDLSRTVPARDHLVVMIVTALLLLSGGTLLHGLLRARYQRQKTTRQLQDYARAQENAAVRKEMLATAGLRMQQERTADALAQTFLREAHRLIGTLQGVVYVVGDNGNLQLLASYADTPETPETLALGEGLLGQCALERQSRVVATTPAGFATIRSGLGEAMPAAVMMAPLVLKAELLGAIEVAVLKMPEDAEREQFEELAQLLAIHLEIVGSVVREHAPAPEVRS